MPVEQLLLADAPERLERGLELLEDLPVVGVDVERADSDRYFRAAALIQVGGAGLVALVDPLALPDLEPLQRFLAQRVTILHALDNDVGPLASAGARPSQVQDTAVAAAVLGLPTGLETLLRDLLGVALPGDKAAMQRAAWEARPLTAAMLAYAASDVADLPALWDELAQRLVATGRLDWYRQELAYQLALPPAEERREWTRIKGLGRLDAGSRARVQALWRAREELARATDTAPGRIIGDRVLLDLGQVPPRGVDELGRRGMRRSAIREFGPALLRALNAPLEPEPPRQSRRAPTEAQKELADRLRELRALRAQKLGIESGVLCPSRTLMTAVMSEPRTPVALSEALGLRPWQWEQLGADFCDAFELEGEGRPPPHSDEPDQHQEPAHG